MANTPLKALRVAREAITGTVKHARNPEWRSAVRAEMNLLPRLVGHTLPTVARNLTGRANTLLQLVQENSRDLPAGLALEMGKTRLTWRELDVLTSRMAHVLRDRGIGHGDVVAIIGNNSPFYVALVFACSRVGATGAMINNHLEGRPLSHAVTAGKAKLILAEAALMSRVDARDDLAEIDRMTFGKGEMEKAVEAAPGAAFPPVDVATDEDFIYIYTSGTTGLPKPCRISHARALSAGAAFGPLMFDFRKGDKLYCVLPLYHASGFMLGIGSCVVMRTPCAMRGSFSASQFWPDVKRYRATAMLYIGELCRYLVNSPEHEDEQDNTLRVAVGNGLRPDVWGPFQERFGIRDVREFYAATEAPGFLLNFSGKRGAVGRMPMGGLGWMKLVRFDVDADEYVRDSEGFCIECGPDEPGELLVKLGSIKTAATEFRGYTDKQATNKKIVTDVFEKGDQYFRSGDLLRRDEEGFFYFVDRIGDTYRWRGENVSTAEVADSLTQASTILEATVIGVQVPGQEGACGLAAVVPDGELDLNDVHACAATLPKYAQPRFIRVLGAMDTTGTFKVQKTRLKKEGADPSGIDDALYVLQGDGYVPLTAELFAGIGEGTVRL